MTFSRKHRPAPKKATTIKKMDVADHSGKSPYTKQNIKKKFNGFEDYDF